MLAPRPLYIGPEARVRLDVGPSLVVDAPGQAAVRVPVAGVARAVIHQQAEAPLAVIALLASVGAPVVIVGGAMRPLALCAGWKRADATLRAQLERLWVLEDWRARYANWRRAQENMAVRVALARAKVAASDVRPQAAAAALERPLVEAGVDAWVRDRGEKAWRACLAAWVAEALARRGWTQDLMERPGIGWHFLHDLVELLVWDMRAYAASEPRRWAKVASAWQQGAAFSSLRRAWIAAFEQRRPRLERLLSGVLARFARWLAEVDACAGAF